MPGSAGLAAKENADGVDDGAAVVGGSAGLGAKEKADEVVAAGVSAGLLREKDDGVAAGVSAGLGLNENVGFGAVVAVPAVVVAGAAIEGNPPCTAELDGGRRKLNFRPEP